MFTNHVLLILKLKNIKLDTLNNIELIILFIFPIIGTTLIFI